MSSSILFFIEIRKSSSKTEIVTPRSKRNNRKEINYNEFSNSETSNEEEVVEDKSPGNEISTERIIARKILFIEEWITISKEYNTSFIREGSRLGWDLDSEGKIEMFLVKWRDLSYLHCSWETLDNLLKLEGKKIYKKVERCYNQENGEIHNIEEKGLVNKDYMTLQSILSKESRNVKYFLCKWKSLSYGDVTWESEQDLVQFKDKISEFENRKELVKNSKSVEWRPTEEQLKLGFECIRKYNGNELRPYQIEGSTFLLLNWYVNRSSILADEMGLGKTIQAIAFLRQLQTYECKGPHLIIVPLSTMSNWIKELEKWSNFRVLVYTGDSKSRGIIHEYCWQDKNKIPLFDICLTTTNMCSISVEKFVSIDWNVMIVDEGHCLKGVNSKTRKTLMRFNTNYKILLTGTPVQNEIIELWQLLNFLDPVEFETYELFVQRFGELKDVEELNKFQLVLKDYLLRRMKIDVEKSLKPKQETIIEVELTSYQKKYYRAIYERNYSYLIQEDKKQRVSLKNIMMQLRKCCNHVFLLNDVENRLQEEKEIDPSKESYLSDSMNLLIESSGKIILLDKLLPKLLSQNHKVLLFSQMIRMLDIIQDFLAYRNYTFVRLDGTMSNEEREESISKFNNQDNKIFVFLMSTKAGGLGINLTSADIVIIYDSDWNPQVLPKIINRMTFKPKPGVIELVKPKLCKCTDSYHPKHMKQN